MERNNLKKITGSRWFLPVVCAVSFVFGWWYLSITTCAPLGGDDEIINLQNYYYITHTPWRQVVLTHAKEILNQLALQSPRFRPFSSPPVRSLNSWFLGDLVVYRLYILAWTYADIALTAWLTAKATHSKKLGALAFCLLPMMFSLWQDATGNSMYSYGALAQSTLLPVLLAGLCMLRWQDTRRMRWAVLSAFFMFMACGTFEIGFTYIAALFGVAWLYTGSGKVLPALRLCVAPLSGEVVSFGFNMGSRLVNNLRRAGILEGQGIDIGGVSPNFDLPAVLRTWVMQMSAGFPLNAMVFGKIKPTNVQISDVICGVALAACVMAVLALLDRLPTRRSRPKSVHWWSGPRSGNPPTSRDRVRPSPPPPSARRRLLTSGPVYSAPRAGPRIGAAQAEALPERVQPGHAKQRGDIRKADFKVPQAMNMKDRHRHRMRQQCPAQHAQAQAAPAAACFAPRRVHMLPVASCQRRTSWAAQKRQRTQLFAVGFGGQPGRGNVRASTAGRPPDRPGLLRERSRRRGKQPDMPGHLAQNFLGVSHSHLRCG